MMFRHLTTKLAKVAFVACPILVGAASAFAQVPACFRDLTGDVGAKRRLECVKSLFSPQPGDSENLATLDPREVRDFRHLSPLEWRGSIEVIPPKGRCLKITRAEDVPDTSVCAKSRITFQAADLDKGGRLRWRVSTGPGDFGTDVTWQTPHRIAMFMKPTRAITPEELAKPRKDTPPLSILKKTVIEKCVVDPTIARTNPGAGTRTYPVVLLMADGSQWIIHFPFKDTLSPDQGEKIGNLYVQSHGALATEALQAAKAEKAEKEKEAAGGHGGGGEGEGGAEEAKPNEKKAPDSPFAVKKKERREMWVVPPWESFVLKGDDFIDTSASRGGRGTCRYHLRNAPDDKDNGWIECHDTAGFAVVIAPIACTKELLTTRENTTK